MNYTRFSLQTPVITIPSFSFNRIFQLHSAIISIHSQPTKNDTTPQRESTSLPRPLYNCCNTSHTHQQPNRRRNRFLILSCSGIGSFQTIITITQNNINQPHSKPSNTHSLLQTPIPHIPSISEMIVHHHPNALHSENNASQPTHLETPVPFQNTETNP